MAPALTQTAVAVGIGTVVQMAKSTSLWCLLPVIKLIGLPMVFCGRLPTGAVLTSVLQLPPPGLCGQLAGSVSVPGSGELSGGVSWAVAGCTMSSTPTLRDSVLTVTSNSPYSPPVDENQSAVEVSALNQPPGG